MRKLQLLLLIALILYATSCQDDDLSSSKELLSFKIEKELNPQLEETIVGEIKDNNIHITIHDTHLSDRLVVTFQHNGKAVYVDNQEQISGISTKSFSDNITYRVQAEDKSENIYRVKTHIISTTNELISLTFEREHNPQLFEDIIATIDGDEIIIYLREDIDPTHLIATFRYYGAEILINNQPQESGVTPNDFTQPIQYTIIAKNGDKKTYTVIYKQTAINKDKVPHIYIDIDNGEAMEKHDKRRELNATIRIDGKGKYDNYVGATTIRGRGNTTWYMPKQPYRLKLNKSAPLFGLASHKRWVLLNMYLDGSMMDNAIPYKAAQLLDMPYTNTIIPVELTINDEYRGMYAFTEHKEVREGRIDIGDDGWLLELDSHYDEDWQFKSENYNLPVMIQHPKSKNMDYELFKTIREDFNRFERKVYDKSFPNNDYLDYFDDLSFVNYMIVYQLTLNDEINHPKSTYINKPKGEKYRMGIVWDFDWAYGYYGHSHYRLSEANNHIFWGHYSVGTAFFSRFMHDPHLQALFKERWQWFKDNKMEELKTHVREYAAIIDQGISNDHSIWGRRNASDNAHQRLQKVLDWMDARSRYIDNYSADF